MAIDLADILNLGLTAYNASQGNAGGAASGLSGILGPIFSSGSAPTTGGQGGGFLSSIFGSDSPVSENPVSEGGGIMDSLGSIFGGSSNQPTGYTGPSVWPQVLGSLASSFRATPRAGASREEREKASRYNMLAGILGAVATGYGKASDEAAKQKATSELYQIFTGARPSTVGAESSDPMQKLPMPYSEPPARKEDYIQNLPMPAGAAPLTKSDLEQTQEIRFDRLPSQASTPLSRNERLAEFMRQNPAMADVAGQLLAKEQESQFKLADLEARKAAVQSQREMADAKLAFLKGKLQQDIESGASNIQIRQRANEIKAAEVEAKQQREGQSAARSALNTELNFNNQAIKGIDRRFDLLGKLLPQTDEDRQAVETEVSDLDRQRKALIERNNQLQQELKSGQQFAPPTAQQETPITATTQQQAVDALKQLGLSQDEINSYQKGISKLPTTQTTTEPLAVQATPTATPTPEATRNPLAKLMGSTTRAAASAKQLEESVKYEEALAKVSPEYITYKTKYALIEEAYGKLKRAFDSNNPAATNAAVTEFIRSLDDSVVQKGDRESFMRGVMTKKDEMLAYANSWLGRSVDLPAKAKQRIENYAKLARDYYQKSEAAAQIVGTQLLKDRNAKIRNTSFNLYWNGDPENGVLDLVTATKYGVPFGTKKIRRP